VGLPEEIRVWGKRVTTKFASEEEATRAFDAAKDKPETARAASFGQALYLLSHGKM
jgi:hypothetical protein